MYLPKGGRPQVNSSVALVFSFFPLSSDYPGVPVGDLGRPFSDDEVHFLLLYRLIPIFATPRLHSAPRARSDPALSLWFVLK